MSPDGRHLFMMGFGSTPGFYPSGEPGTVNGALVLTKVEIPSGNFSSLPTAKLVQELNLVGRLQTRSDCTPGSPDFEFYAFNNELPAVVVDDLVVVDYKLIGSAYVGYYG